MGDELEYTPELGDTVTFKAWGEYGEVTGDGEILRIYKNGNIQVEMHGRKYKAGEYELLSRAG